MKLKPIPKGSFSISQEKEIRKIMNVAIKSLQEHSFFPASGFHKYPLKSYLIP